MILVSAVRPGAGLQYFQRFIFIVPLNLFLLNNDYKVFAKMVAILLKRVVSLLIHVDQVSFIAGRLTSSSMRRLFHIMSRVASIQHPVVPMSMDTKKAFDRTERP